jgi:uncharacterized protein (DUF1697 family)
VTAYAAFLRGINLGPTNKVAMPRLREIAGELGWGDVATYINSGNLVFTSTKKPATLEEDLQAALQRELGKKIDVTVRSHAQLAKIVSGNPYPDGASNQVNVAFLMRPLPSDAVTALAAMATEREPFSVAGSEIYIHYQDGLGRSKLAEKFASVIKVSCTTRNIGTVTKVLALLDELTGLRGLGAPAERSGG